MSIILHSHSNPPLHDFPQAYLVVYLFYLIEWNSVELHTCSVEFGWSCELSRTAIILGFPPLSFHHPENYFFHSPKLEPHFLDSIFFSLFKKFIPSFYLRTYCSCFLRKSTRVINLWDCLVFYPHTLCRLWAQNIRFKEAFSFWIWKFSSMSSNF